MSPYDCQEVSMLPLNICFFHGLLPAGVNPPAYALRP